MTLRQKRISGTILGACLAVLLTIPAHRLVAHHRLSDCSFPDECRALQKQIMEDGSISQWILWFFLGCEECVFGEGGVMPVTPTARPVLGVSRVHPVAAHGTRASGDSRVRLHGRGGDRAGGVAAVSSRQ